MQPSSLALYPLILGALTITMPALAETDPLAVRRALNLARNSAVAVNGGLRLYHPAGCMFGDTRDNPCLTRRDSDGIEFQFRGGPPGWEVLELPATVESTVMISPDGGTVLEADHKEIGLPPSTNAESDQ